MTNKIIYDLIIVGGGPAGITAGIYAGRQRMKTLLLAKSFGGQMTKKATEICNYPGFVRISGFDLIEKFVEHLKAETDVEIKTSEVLKVAKGPKGCPDNFVVATSAQEKFLGRSIIIATGADPRPLEVEGEKEFIGRGVSYCVLCDGPLFKNKDVAVVGGGDAGFEAALFMTNYAKKIHILEFGPEVKADQINQDQVKKSKKIEVITHAAVRKIRGDKMVSSLIYEDLLSKENKELKVEGVFIEIGSQPATSMVKNLVDFNKRDEIVVEPETFQTKTPGLFAAGDVNMGSYKQIVTAAGEGCKTALAAYEYLKKTKK